MGCFNQDCPQRGIGGPDQARIRLPLPTGSIAWAQSTKARQLLARAETIKVTDLGADGPGCHRANTRLLLQPLHFHVVGGHMLESLLHLADLAGPTRQFAQLLLPQPPTLLTALGCMTHPLLPGLRPGIQPFGGMAPLLSEQRSQ